MNLKLLNVHAVTQTKYETLRGAPTISANAAIALSALSTKAVTSSDIFNQAFISGVDKIS
jgi:hypothetical protein